jgi:hypothetical protein
MELFCDGVKMLLERMETNPEEFVFGHIGEEYDDSTIAESKWYKYLPTRSDKQLEDDGYDLGLDCCELYLTEEEKHALRTKLNLLYRTSYSQLVMTKIIAGDTPKKRRK